MSFKDDVLDDIQEVFFDTDEFAVEHLVNGKKIPIIIDEKELARRTVRSGRHSSYEDGIHRKSLVFYAAAKDFGRPPTVNSDMTIDGKVKMIVANVNTDSGMYEITLTGGNR